MSDSVQGAAAGERPDALQRAAADFQKRPAFYLGWVAVALVAMITIQIATRWESGPGEDHFSPVWAAYVEAREKVASNQPAPAELARLGQARESARGTNAEASALWLSAIAHYGAAFTKEKITFEDRRPDLEAARDALAELRSGNFDYYPTAMKHFFSTGGKPPVDDMYDRVVADLEWAKDNAQSNPQPDESPTVVLRTDEGDVYLRFFGTLAPKHVENFLTLVKAGAYNGTAFHFVSGGAKPDSLGAGDPLTYFYNDPFKKTHILRWGEGGTGYNLPPEQARFRISHVRGIVTSQRPSNADWDNGSQFRILLDTDPTIDRQHTPFAQVVEGLDVVEKAASRPTASGHATYKDDTEFTTLGTRGLIVEPALIEKAIAYDASGAAMEHAFPLADGEKKLSTLKSAPLKPLSEEELRAGRTLVDPSKATQYRKGIDIPFPADLSDPDSASAAGERRVPENVNATGQGDGSGEEKKDEEEKKPDGG